VSMSGENDAIAAAMSRTPGSQLQRQNVRAETEGYAAEEPPAATCIGTHALVHRLGAFLKPWRGSFEEAHGAFG
jgi:hypothetical protein